MHGQPPISADRSPYRFEEITRDLRRRILTGEWGPGTGLPTQRQLMESYSVGDTTIRQAVTTLVQDGFLIATRRRGTFVTERPPHLTHIGVVFPFTHASRPSWSPFYRALAEGAENLHTLSPYHASVYAINAGWPEDVAYQRLERDVQVSRLAGLIYTVPPFQVIGRPPLEAPGIPRVSIMQFLTFPQVPAIVWFDLHSFTEKAVEFCLARGRRQIAMLTTTAPQPPDSYGVHLRAALAKRRILSPEFWVQLANDDVRNLTHLLVHTGQAQRPDALIITEDTIVEDVIAGVLAAGLRVPDDIDIITHANFPHPIPTSVPVTRLGYSVPELFSACVRLIDAQRRGETFPAITRIPAYFEHEVAQPR